MKSAPNFESAYYYFTRKGESEMGYLHGDFVDAAGKFILKDLAKTVESGVRLKYSEYFDDGSSDRFKAFMRRAIRAKRCQSMKRIEDVKSEMREADNVGPTALDTAIHDLETLGLVKTRRNLPHAMTDGELDYEFWLTARGRIAIMEKAPIGFCGADL